MPQLFTTSFTTILHEHAENSRSQGQGCLSFVFTTHITAHITAYITTGEPACRVSLARGARTSSAPPHPRPLRPHTGACGAGARTQLLPARYRLFLGIFIFPPFFFITPTHLCVWRMRVLLRAHSYQLASVFFFEDFPPRFFFRFVVQSDLTAR